MCCNLSFYHSDMLTLNRTKPTGSLLWICCFAVVCLHELLSSQHKWDTSRKTPDLRFHTDINMNAFLRGKIRKRVDTQVASLIAKPLLNAVLYQYC